MACKSFALTYLTTFVPQLWRWPSKYSHKYVLTPVSVKGVECDAPPSRNELVA
jgi:hypothetical protein